MKKKSGNFSRRNFLLTVLAVVIVIASFLVGSGDLIGAQSSLAASVIASFIGRPTIVISRDSASPRGTIQAGNTAQLLAVYDVVSKNVTHWATLQQLSGQVTITSAQSLLWLSSIKVTYSYCIPRGKTYGYGWQGGGCAIITLPATLSSLSSDSYSKVYRLTFNTQIPIYPEASPSTFMVYAAPQYPYTGTTTRTGTEDATLDVQLSQISATGDQCKTVYYGYKNKYSYSQCSYSSAALSVMGNSNQLTVVRPYGYGYKTLTASKRR